MTLATALRLARPSSTADRGRFALIAGATAMAGALLLAALHILRMPASASGRVEGDAELANYVTESGLRPGVLVAALLLTVPIFAFAVQVLRIGSVARERRLASLRLAGATPRDVRLISAAEAGGAALAGGVLAGAAYLVLWLVVGVLPPPRARMLTAPDALDLDAWVAVIPLAALAGAIAGAAIHGRVVVEPLGVRRRGRVAAPGGANLAGLLAGVAVVTASLAVIPLLAGGTVGLGLLALAIVGLLVVAFTSGPRLAFAYAGMLERRRGVEFLLANRRLAADPRSAGRAAGVLFVCGLALGVEALLLAGQIADASWRSGIVTDTTFYVTGYAMTAIVVLVAAGVALLTLLVGAADGLLDARRPLATLAALGVDERMLERVVSQQLSATAVPAIAAGALVAPGLALLGRSEGSYALWVLLPTVITVLVAALAMAVAARVAARLLRSVIRAAIDPENLRVA